MKTTMKKRMVSGLLALAMLLSFLPESLFPKAEALNFPTADLQIESDGSFTATFQVEGAIPWDSGNSRYTIGDHYFVLVPDIKATTAHPTTVGEAIAAGRISASTQNLVAFKNVMNQRTGITWDDTVCFALDNGQVVDDGGNVTITESTVTIKGTLPNPDQLGIIYPGYVARAGSGGTPYVAFLYSGQQPNGIGYDTAEYNLAGLRLTPENNTVSYQYDLENGIVNQWMVNGTDQMGNWATEEAWDPAYIELSLENLGAEEIYITGFELVEAKDVLVEGNPLEEGDAPENYFSIADAYDAFLENCPDGRIDGKGTNTWQLDLVNTIAAVSSLVTGTFKAQVNWQNANGVDQEPVYFTVVLTTETSSWTPPELTLSVEAFKDDKPAAKTGTVTWNGPDGTFADLPTLDGTLAGSGGELKFYRGNTTAANAEIRAGDVITDGEVVTVYFQPPSGKGVGTYLRTKALTASGISATLNLELIVKPKTANTTVTILKDGAAWNQSENHFSVELDDGANTFAGTWSGNVWTASTTLESGDYNILVNGQNVGTIHVTYGVSTNQDVNYYTVSVSTNPAGGGSAWIGDTNTTTSVVVLSGSDVTIHAQANGGWSFNGWTGSATLSNAVETISNITSARSYTANFGSSSVTVQVYLDGTGDTAGRQVRLMKDGAQYGDILTTDASNKGVFTLTAVPAGTYTVETRQSATDTWVTASPSGTLTVDAAGGSATVKYWTVTVGAGAHVDSKWADTNVNSTSGSSINVVVLDGKNAALHARPETGYDTPATWTGTLPNGTTAPKSGDDITITNVKGTLTYTPGYDKYSGKVTVNLDGSAYTAFPAGSSVVVGSASVTAPTGADRSVWNYSGATGTVAVTTSGDATHDGTPNPAVSVTGTNRDVTVNYYSLTQSVGTGGAAAGSVTVAKNGNYLVGKKVTIAATANAGYQFVNWTTLAGVEVSKSASYEVTMDKKQELVANFKASEITYNGGSHTYTYNQAASPDKTVAGSTGVTGVTFVSYAIKEGSMPPGLTLGTDGTITGTPTLAGTYTITVEATASNGKKPTAVWTITVNKVRLPAPVIAKKNDVSVANGSDGAITMTNPNYPVDAGVTYSLLKSNVATGTTAPTNWEYTGLKAGTYTVQATLSAEGAKNYEWVSPVTGQATKSNSNSVEITQPGVNNPTITQSQTYEKNTAITTRAPTITFNFNVGDWQTLSGLEIDGKAIASTDYTVVQPSGGKKTGTVSVAATVLDGMGLTNGTKSVKATFHRTGFDSGETNTATENLLTVQTTYTVQFDLNGGTAASGGVPSIANQTITNTTVPTFKWASIANNTPTKEGYAFAGWDTNGSDSTAEWRSNNVNYQPSTDASDASKWNTTVKAVWTANVVTVTTKLNGAAVSGRTITLYQSGTATAHTGVTNASGQVVFSGVAAGTYQIYDELTVGSQKDTGVTVAATAGGSTSAEIRYYDVEYQDVKSGIDHGIYTGVTSPDVPASGNVIINSSLNDRRKVTLPGTTADTNYVHSSWTLTPSSGVGTAPLAAAKDWTATQSTTYTTAGSIKLKPVFTKNKASITVNVSRNGQKVASSIDVNLTGPSSYNKTNTGVTTGTTTFDSLSAGTYTAGVVGWTTSSSTTKQATIANTYGDRTIDLAYFDYHFDANTPDAATAAGKTVAGMPAAPTAPVLTGYGVTEPTAPTLDGYTFQGWATGKGGPAAGWSTINTITKETTFYAIWSANTVTLANMTAYGALNVQGIRGFTANKGTGTGHNSDTDFTYEVWDGSKWATTHSIDGITVAAGATLAVSGTPTKAGTVAAPTTTTTFRVRAVSKINGMVSATAANSATTITVTSYPTYRVEYVKNSGGNDSSVSGTLPTDSNLYVVSDKDFTGAQGSGGETVVANTISASASRLTWAGNARTHLGWSDAASGSVANSFTVSSVAAANRQNKAPGGTLTLYAIWEGKDLSFRSQTMDADYNMNGDQWLASSYYTPPANTGDPDVNLTGFDVTKFVGNGTDNLEFTVTNVPDFMEYDADSKILKLKDNTRVGNVNTYTINVKVVDKGNGNAETTGTVTLTVHKTTPIIDGWGKKPTSTGPYYTKDVVWPETTYVNVHDPYDETKILSTPTTNPSGDQWSDKTQTFQTGKHTYSYTYTPVDETNYNTPDDVSVTFEAAERAISLQVKDDDKNAPWSSKYTNSNTPTYDPTPNWKTVKVSIRNPAGSNSPIDKLTWSQTAGTGDDTFKDIKIVQADGTTERPSPSTLAAGDTGEYILTFAVNVNASGSHTLTFKFDGVAGADGQPSRKTASATYTYTTVAQANKLATPDPDLTRVEVRDAISHPDGSNDDPDIDYTGEDFKDQNGAAVDETLGGLHLIFKPIAQDNSKNDATNPVKHYVVTLTGNKAGTATPNSITITPDQVDEDGYFHYYWDADLTNGPVPNSDYTVEVQAFSRNTDLYEDSDKGDDATKAGYRDLTVANWGQLTDKVFNGRQQNGGSLTSPTGVGAITVRYYEDSTTPAATLPLATTGLDTSKLHVNIDPESDGNEYAVYVTVAQGTLYLPITEPALYPYAGNKAGNDPYWKITQAKATMTLGKSSSNGQTMTPADIRPNPTVTYPKGNGTGDAEYNNGTVTGYYDIVYTVTSSPTGSTHAVGNTLTETELQNFMADKAGTYNFKASAVYKTGDDENLQFQADVSQAENTFTFTTGNRTVTKITLERYEAVNGTTGVKDIDTGANMTEDRGVTYGNTVDAIADTRRGYYDATSNITSKQMRLDGLRITVYWSGGDPDVYIVGADGLPGDAVWTSSKTNVAASPAITDNILTFKGAGVNKSFSTNLTFSYGNKTSNPVTYTMEKRAIDYTVVSDDERVWNASSTVNGTLEWELPDNLAGDQVEIALGSAKFQTTTLKYSAWNGTPYGADAGYTPDHNVGKDKLVRAQKQGTSGSGTDVTGADKAFYKRGTETPGKATIKPARVTKTNVVLTEPSASTVNNENKISNNRYKPSTDGIEDELKTKTGWSVPVVSIKWEAWDDATGTWVEETDHFSIDTVYRATVVVEADTNHYMSEDEIDNYTIRGKKNGDYAIEDLDDWNNREENKVTVTVDQSGPFHPDWLPDTEVLYHNRTTFTYVFHTFETPSLQFSDEEKSFDPTTPNIGTHHEPSNYVHHTETVTEGDSGKTYTITVNAAVKDIFGAQVLMTNKELLDAGATLKVVQGNGTIDVATPVRTDRTVPMYKMSSDEYKADQDLIIYELTIPDSVMAKEGTYHLEFQAMGSTSFANMDAGKVDVAKSYYTFTLVVREKQQPPVISGGSSEVELPVVTYWLSSYGYTNDLTAEKMSRRGAKPSFTPKITPLAGLRFLGWSETDPSKITDGKLPTLVDPLTFSINEDKIFYAVYEWIGHSHYVIGFPDGTFGPDNSITRGQVATIIARACLDGFVEGSDYGNPGNYNDVDSHWAASAIAYCSLRGVFAGYEDGTFRPDRNISRQELATVVARLAGVQANQGLTFSDSGDVANWALNGVYTNVANGWVNGYEDNTFRPLQNITRAETVKIFNGYLGRGVNAEGLEGLTEYIHSGVASNNSSNTENKEYMTWPDVTKAHWAYYEVIEAANDHDYHWIDATKAAPPEKWDAAYIDETWRYYDNANDGGENVGKETATFTVTYMLPNGEPVSETVKIYESPSVELLLAVQDQLTVPEGFYLVGWSMLDPAVYEITEDDLLKPDPTAHYVEEDRTFYPVFEQIPEYVLPTVVVTYVIGSYGVTESPLTEELQMYESPTVAGRPKVTALEGCQFLGWSRKNPALEEVTQDDLLDPTAFPVLENTTFYAVYSGEAVTILPPVTVTYVIGEQGTTASAVTESVAAGGVPTALPQIQPVEGWQLAGWSETDPAALGEGEEPVLTDPLIIPLEADKTYYAIYRPAEVGETVTVTVTYQVIPYEGGSYEPVLQSVTAGTNPAALPEIPTFEGWELGGWTETDPATLAEGEELVLTDPLTTLVEVDKTYYAIYRPAQVVEMVTVTYLVSSASGMSYDPITEQVARDTAVTAETLPVAVPDPGFAFAGWSVTDPTAGEVTLVEPTTVVLTEDTTFYAVFRPEQPVTPIEPTEPVVYARTRYINGFEDGTFRPDEGISRAAVAKIIADLLQYDGGEMEDTGFVDLENHWARNVIAYCIQKGVLNGYEDSTFRPDNAVTRQEFAVIIGRLAGTRSNQGLTFTDVDTIAPWALDGVYTAVVNGWINGYEDGTFLPERVMTRAETVKIFNAYLGRSANAEAIEAVSGYTAWSDVPATHWAYYEIVEAANDWEALAQQDQSADQPAPEEGQVSGENTDETVPVEGDDATAGQPTEGEDPTQTPGEGAQQPGEGETSDQPENGGQDEMQSDNGEDAATPNEGEDPALPNDEENEDNAGEGEDAPTDGDDQ